jgi:hypothetical protein
MKSVRFFLPSFLLFSVISFTNYAQDTSTDRVGFSSLFKVVQADTQNTHFQYQLNPKAVSFIQSYMESRVPHCKR